MSGLTSLFMFNRLSGQTSTRFAKTAVVLFFYLSISACTSLPNLDETALEKAKPKSIVVLPPRNKSTEILAPYTFLSTITRPLSEKGYYVYPVAVIDQLLKENGLPTSVEMHAIPLDKIREHIGADAVLYVTIEDWGQKYRVLSSNTIVRFSMRLVDVRSGQTLWSGDGEASQHDNVVQSSSLGEKMLGAIVGQITGSLMDYTPDLARTANTQTLEHSSRGLPDGPYRNIQETLKK